ncbi:hypothetical protein LBMAG22_02770 [Bacteroidota bacterium]|jgi:hypothetical protein|nr:hypothetical protein LBMAG22_02770 [Bacteroidota bacterium]
MKNAARILLLIGCTFSLLGFQCEKQVNGPLLKGKLAVNGICSNITITLVEGNLDPGQFENNWTDPTTGITYQNAFRLANPCQFPSHIREGNEFYFRVTTRVNETCATCLAYYPTPQTALAIQVE